MKDKDIDEIMLLALNDSVDEDDFGSPQRDLAALERMQEFTAQADAELKRANECHVQCEGQADLIRRALADADAAQRAHDQWLAQATKHRKRATKLLQAAVQLRTEVEARMARRKSGES